MRWLEVNSIWGPAPGMVTSATRSAGLSVPTNRFAASIAGLPRPDPMLPASMTSITRRPPAAPALELYSSGLGGALSIARSTEMNCAEAIRRGLPSTVSEKSSAARSATGRPVLSTTLTSTGTRSTADLNVVFGACGSCPARTTPSASAAAKTFMRRVYCGLWRVSR